MKFFKRIAQLLLVLIVSYAVWVFTSYPKVSGLPELKTGDIVFQTTNTPQTTAIMLASLSPYSHVGIVIANGNSYSVIEAVGPVREIPLQKWIEQGIANRIGIKRVKVLSAEQAKRMVNKAKSFIGRDYDFHFTLDTNQIYCSELVYHASNGVLPSPIGSVQKTGELFIDNPAAQRVIKRRWQSQPTCKKEKLDYDACFAHIISEPIVTPASLARDQKLSTIYTNYHPF